MGFASELMGLVNNRTQSLADILLDLVPADGSAIRNQSLYPVSYTHLTLPTSDLV